MKVKYPLIRHHFDYSDEKSVADVLSSGWLTEGKYVKKLEEKIENYNKVKHAFLLNSATSGLMAAVMALGLKTDDNVIVPSFTFPATANAVISGGAKPVFCDIDLTTFNMSAGMLERLIDRNTKAIMPVHEFGLPADMENIMRIAKKYKLFIIEDAACSLGAEFKKIKTGAFGDMGVFSFHPRKIITCGEGGCLVTSSPKIAKRIGLYKNHGAYGRRFIDRGYNFRLSDLQAAILINQFNNLERIIARRAKLALNYNKLLESFEKNEVLQRPRCPENYRHVYQSYVILLSNKIKNAKLIAFLKQKGIETQFGAYCVPMLDFYRKNFSIPRHAYHNAYYAYRHSLTLPLYHTLKMDEQEFIVNELKKAVQKCAA